MKLKNDKKAIFTAAPAAFRRLCVETYFAIRSIEETLPAAFRRLCVETASGAYISIKCPKPAAFRRLCVETKRKNRLMCCLRGQPPSGGCVLKQF